MLGPIIAAAWVACKHLVSQGQCCHGHSVQGLDDTQPPVLCNLISSYLDDTHNASWQTTRSSAHTAGSCIMVAGDFAKVIASFAPNGVLISDFNELLDTPAKIQA